MTKEKVPSEEEQVEEQPKQEKVEEKQPDKEMSNFKEQLAQALELNDQLIAELDNKEKQLSEMTKEFSTFKKYQETVSETIHAKDEQIQTLQAELQEVKMSVFKKKQDEVYTKWLHVYDIPKENADSVQKMLSKFDSVDELEEMERMLDNMPRKKMASVSPLTRPSEELAVSSFKQDTVPYESLSQEEKLQMLSLQAEKLLKQGD